MTSRATPAPTRRPPTGSRSGLVGAWAHVLRTANPPAGRDLRALDPVTRWLLATRAAALPVTLLAGLVAGLLAVRAEGFSWPLYLLALVGILLAHACSNLMDDLADLHPVHDRDHDADLGPGRDAPPRVLYAPHPVLSGLLRRRQVGLAVVGLHLADLVVLVVLALQRGWPVVAFALAGVVLSLGYAAPPLRLKARGLGEPAALLVWGPLMVAGTYVAAVGELPWQVWLASVPCGLLCTGVLLGKHLDEREPDAATGTRTLPVVVGDAGGRALVLGVLVGFYATTGLAVALGALPWPALLVALALPVLRRVAGVLRVPGRGEAPGGQRSHRSAAALVAHLRRAGGLLVLGLAGAAALGVGLPLGA